jgi:hypothetical protein
VLPPAEQGASFVSPARWDFHPPAPTVALAAAKVAGGACVFTAEGGQRWSAAASKMAGSRLVCAGKAEVSTAVSAEELTSVIRRADGSWIYVGESGSLFEAPDALAPFTRVVPAPEPLGKVAGAGAAVLATTLEGHLLRWEAATGWRPVAASPALGGARVLDVVVGDAGKALALAFPEALFASEDGGATWAASGAPRIGARLLGRTAAGELGAQGLFESVVWRAPSAPNVTADPPFARGAEKIHAPQAALEVEVGRAPAAASVLTGRAALDGDRYYEVIRPETEGEAWLLARGRIDGRLETAPLPDSKPCSSMRLGARGKHLVRVCVSADGEQIAAEVRESADQGATWGDPLKLLTLDTDQINLAVAPDGAVLMTGVCRVAETACKPAGPLAIRVALATDGGAAAPRLTPVAAPQLSGAALLPAYSVDGRSAYFLGHRGKDDRLNLFVSHDGGESFSPRAIEVTAGVRVAKRPRGDDDDEPAEEPVDSFDVDDQSFLRVGDDGVVGMLMARARGDVVYVTADDDGRILQVGTPPVDSTEDDGRGGSTMLMTGHGRRVIAIPLSVPDSGTGIVYESLDGGATWDRQAAPQALVREYYRGALVGVCALGGCVLGETVTRLGWGGQPDAAAVDRPAEPAHEGTQSVLTPIVCDLSAATRWTPVDNVAGQLVPGMAQAMRGRSVWSAITVDRKTGAVAAVSANLPESGEGEARVTTRQLLGPRPASAHLATALALSEYEGYAAARVPVPVDAQGKPQAGASMRNLEVVWENYLEGAQSRAKIPDAGPFEKGDVTLGEVKSGRGDDGELVYVADVLHATLLSITSHGIFVRPHARTQRAVEIFVDGAGRVDLREATPWPSTSPLGPTLDFRAEAAAVGGNLFGLGLLRDDGDWGAVSLARRPGAAGPWAYSAASILPPHAVSGPLLMHASMAWSPKLPVAVFGLVADPAHARAWAHVLGVRGDGTFGPAEPVPTIADLPDRARGCTPAERAATPRVGLPFLLESNRVLFPGQRHPVLVREPRGRNAVGVDEPTVLLTGGAVVQGTPASPCVSAWEAAGVASGPVAAVLPGDLAHAWLFRPARDGSRPTKRGDPGDPVPAFEYRPMSCRFDPQARAPDAVWSEPGTTRP